jgi:hypothetical protein
MNRHLLFIAAFAIAATSCAESIPESVSDPVAEPSSESVEVPLGWKLLNAGPFSFYAPADVVVATNPGIPIDSLVGHYRGASIALLFDYGRYSNSLSDLNGNPTFRSHEELVGGRRARLASWSENQTGDGQPWNVHAVYFRDTGRQDMRLMMSATCSDYVACRDAEEIFRTVRFAK